MFVFCGYRFVRFCCFFLFCLLWNFYTCVGCVVWLCCVFLFSFSCTRVCLVFSYCYLCSTHIHLFSLGVFNWLFIVVLTARSYRDWHCFSCLKMIPILIYWTSTVTHEIFPLSMEDVNRALSKVVFGSRPTWTSMWLSNPICLGRYLSGRVQCSHWATSATWTTMRSGNPIYHERHLLGRVQCSHLAPSDETNHEIRQLHLYEFLSIRSSPFWQQWFQITRNSKH